MNKDLDQGITFLIKADLILILMALNIEIEQVGYLLVLMFFDSLFGALRAVALKEGFSLFLLAWRVLVKLCVLIIPFLVAGFGVVFDINLTYIVQVFIFTIASNDLVSIFANIMSVRTGNHIKSVDYIEKFLESIKGVFTGLVRARQSSITDNEDEKGRQTKR